MGRISRQVIIRNSMDPEKEIRCDALVDTGATMMTLPASWRERLGNFPLANKVELEVATHQRVEGEVCGPATIQIEGFPPISSEVAFLDMESEYGTPEPLIGYITLEQSGAAVDMAGHRLIHLPHYDLK